MNERRKINKMRISDLRVITCGFFLEGSPRYDTLWEALNHSDIKELIDFREKRVLSEKQLDILRAEWEVSIFHRIVGTIRSLYNLYRRTVTIIRAVRGKRVDIIFIFHGNYFLAICLGMLKFIHGASVYFDLFCSAYSSTRTATPRRFDIAEANILTFLSGWSADQLLCLTQEYARHYQKIYKIRASKLSVIPDGIQDIWFEQPVDVRQEKRHSKRVLYWGSFLVQHGLDMIINSVEELKDENIEFVFCGKGEGASWARAEVIRRNLSNVVFEGFIPTTEDLINVVDTADITFGHLRDVHDVRLGAPLKQLQGMARRKLVIALWTRQQEKLYQTKDNPLPPLIQIEPGTSRTLTKAIRQVINNPEKAEQIGDIARTTVKRLHGAEAVTSALKESLGKTLRKGEIRR